MGLLRDIRNAVAEIDLKREVLRNVVAEIWLLAAHFKKIKDESIILVFDFFHNNLPIIWAI
jgi:hypothetical protein